jgi:dynein heavy chain, axonemal
LLRQFCILSMPDPSAKSLFNIYQVQLGRFFSEHEFNIDVKANLQPVVLSSIVMFYRVVINLLPTPSKSHYVFNLRDLTKLIKGIMQANSIVIVSKENLCNLFAHECVRVFNDRLICKEDNEIFYTNLCETIADYFKISFRNPFKPWLTEKKYGNHQQQQDKEIAAAETGSAMTTTSSLDEALGEFLIYGDFMKNEDRIYQSINNWKQLVSVLSEYQMRSFMAGHAAKQIVFFKEAVEHICR